MVQQPVQQYSGDHRIAEDLPPFTKAEVTGQDYRATLADAVTGYVKYSPCHDSNEVVANE